MSLFDDLKTKADLNGDGKLSIDDLASVKDKISTEQWEKLQAIADRNDDGKIDMADIKGFDFGKALDDLKGSLGDIFKSK